jgi:D-alanine-D-alanine ligase
LVGRNGQVTNLGQVDVAFPLLHGPYGEDGTIQGALELLGVPFVGAGVLASAMGMDKAQSKAVFTAHGLPVTPYVALTPAAWQRDRARLAAQIEALGWPVFVKPSRAGSSLGITKVLGPEGLDAAIVRAAQHDPQVLVERAMTGREVEVAVLGGRHGAPPRAAGPGEIVLLGGHDFYDFEAKYLDNAAVELRCPADLPDGLAARARDMAVRAFQSLGAEGLSRVDFFYDPGAPDGLELVINEINTMPGFTPFSLYPRLWAGEGLGYTALISELIDLAAERPVGLR